MIILDNSVLSAFTRLKLLPQLKEWISSATITKDFSIEYTRYWHKTIPNWIKIKEPNENIEIPNPSVSLSIADLSLIKLGLDLNIPIASDDNPLRQFAKKLGITVTGTLGLLKALFQNNIIKTLDEYMASLKALQKELYISKELLDWALKGLADDDTIEKFMDKYVEE